MFKYLTEGTENDCTHCDGDKDVIDVHVNGGAYVSY